MTLRIQATDCMVLDYSISVKIVFLLCVITDLQTCMIHFLWPFYHLSGHQTRLRQGKLNLLLQPCSVFAFRDAHSDEICYQTVSKPLEDIIKECEAIVTTLIPEQYKPTSTEAKSHSILGRPLYISRNANGHFLWTGKGF